MNPSTLFSMTAPLKGTEVSSVVEIFTLLTVLSVAPLALVALTSFTRIVIVLSFLRQALGTQQSPSNQIIIALSLFISFHGMAPVGHKIEAEAVTPYYKRQIEPQLALDRAWGPLREFLFKQTRKADLALFMQNPGEKEVALQDVAATNLIPAFVISELKT